jgi:hypothetical protein
MISDSVLGSNHFFNVLKKGSTGNRLVCRLFDRTITIYSLFELGKPVELWLGQPIFDLFFLQLYLFIFTLFLYFNLCHPVHHSRTHRTVSQRSHGSIFDPVLKTSG